MATRRKVTVLLGLALTGLLLGALAGAVTVAVLVFAIGLRHGRAVFPITAFGSLLGALLGGPLGALLAPLTARAPLNRVPVGRLFAGLTAGTALGGAAAALLLPSPAAGLLGALVGFVVAADRLASRARVESAEPEVSHTDAA